jgi:arsenate reductase
MSAQSVTIFHNPRCTKSRAALAAAESAGVDVDVVRYLDEPLDEAGLRELIDKLEDPAPALVRRADATAAGIGPGEYADLDGVVAVQVEHPELMERPVLVRAGVAVIGRPTERAEALLRG